MTLTAEQKDGILAQFVVMPKTPVHPKSRSHLLSERINGLGEHFNAHKSDHSSRRGLVKLVNQRRKLLDYLKSTQPQKYQDVVERPGSAPLNLRGAAVSESTRTGAQSSGCHAK